MKKIQIKKLWQGHLISIRDYVVDQGIKNGGIKLEHEGKTMILSPEALSRGRELTRNISSKFSEKKYNLIDFEWKPYDTRQPLLNILKGGIN